MTLVSRRGAWAQARGRSRSRAGGEQHALPVRQQRPAQPHRPPRAALGQRWCVLVLRLRAGFADGLTFGVTREARQNNWDGLADNVSYTGFSCKSGTVTGTVATGGTGTILVAGAYTIPAVFETAKHPWARSPSEPAPDRCSQAADSPCSLDSRVSPRSLPVR